MSPGVKRLLIRLAGFVGVAVGVAMWQQPWAQVVPVYQLAAWAWVFVSGLLGLIVFETIRRRLADQVALDRAEEDALSDETFRKLRRNRFLCRALFTIGLPLWVVLSLGLGECIKEAGTCAFATGVYIIFGYLMGEFVAMLDPRQWVYSRAARRRRVD